jgi:hypothetical protein
MRGVCASLRRPSRFCRETVSTRTKVRSHLFLNLGRFSTPRDDGETAVRQRVSHMSSRFARNARRARDTKSTKSTEYPERAPTGNPLQFTHDQHAEMSKRLNERSKAERNPEAARSRRPWRTCLGSWQRGLPSRSRNHGRADPTDKATGQPRKNPAGNPPGLNPPAAGAHEPADLRFARRTTLPRNRG